MAMIVYGVPGSPYVRSVLVGLEEKHAPYRFAAMSPGEFKQPAHLERHPFGRVPAFEHDGFALYESQAILRYIDAVCPQPPLQPADARTAARMNQLVGIIDWYYFPQVAKTIGFQRVVKPMFLGQPADEEVVAQAMPQAEICFRELGRLATGPFLTGPQLTLADVMLAAHLAMLRLAPEGQALIEGQPNLAAWLARMEARPSVQKTADPKTWAQAA